MTTVDATCTLKVYVYLLLILLTLLHNNYSSTCTCTDWLLITYIIKFSFVCVTLHSVTILMTSWGLSHRKLVYCEDHVFFWNWHSLVNQVLWSLKLHEPWLVLGFSWSLLVIFEINSVLIIVSHCWIDSLAIDIRTGNVFPW